MFELLTQKGKIKIQLKLKRVNKKIYKFFSRHELIERSESEIDSKFEYNLISLLFNFRENSKIDK